jgi:P27 family predicted phage terminase small subunit
MGRRGPKPTPAPLLKLRGSFRRDRAHDDVHPPEGVPDCPDWIDEEAKAAWAHLVPMLQAMGVLTRIDGGALARYVQYWARWKKAELFIQRHGDSYPLKDEKGQIKCIQQFPQVAIAHKLGVLLSKLEQEFGLTPSARSRINLTAAQAQSVAPVGKDRFFGRNATA